MFVRKGGNFMSFVHLHVYSAYSLLQSTVRIDELVYEAKRKGYWAIALTDRNVMYGMIQFYQACVKAQIKPILGLTVDVIHREGEDAYPLVLLAKTEKGFKNLLKISSAVQTTAKDGLPMKWLNAYGGDLIAITPWEKGKIEQCILNENIEEAKKYSNLYVEIFGHDNLYFGLQYHHPNDTIKNEKIMEFIKREQLQIVATNEVYYLNKEDAFSHKCLLAIKDGTKLESDSKDDVLLEGHDLKAPKEMVEIFSQYPEALENSLKIADKCNVLIELGKPKLPKYPLQGEGSAGEFLEQLCLQGLQKRYKTPTREQRERLFYELEVIKKMKYEDYFLIVWDFMKFAREKGILTGPGRGSAAGSLVAYCLYITDIDPIAYDLLFERFLNPERISMPDIDIDFPDNRRDEMIDYVTKKYGPLHVAQIITFGTLASKAVIRDLGRVFNFTTKEIDEFSKMIPSRIGITLQKAYEESEKLRNFVQSSPMKKKLFETALKLEGLPRHTSTHAAGVVISEAPLVEHIPIQSGSGETYLTQYAMEELEQVGLLKMDFLGLRNLTILDTIVKMIKRYGRKNLNMDEMPLHDEKTFALLAKGDTSGVFQLESEGMRSVLQRLKPNHFEDIVAVNALYRPGPMDNIPTYIRRKNGLEPVVYPHPDLEPILKKTYGVIVYQEQIMQIASKMAGFSLGEADLLRRAVSKKKKEILDKERAHFVKGALEKGYDENTAEKIYDLIVKFANYGFNRSHAVAYSYIAYQLAYLKAHFPLYFMAALLTSVIGHEGKIAQYIRECRGMGIQILPPSINKSQYAFIVEGDKIRYSLAAIKGVGTVALKDIIQARQNKPFTDLFDFCVKVSSRAVNRKVLEALVHSGSFDEFGYDRSVLLATLDVALEHRELVRPDDDSGDLFAESDEFMIKPKYVEQEPFSTEEKLKFEKEVLGLYLSDHPVSIYEPYFHLLKINPIAEGMSQQKIRLFVHIGEIRKIRTKKGEEMAFLQLSDQTGDLDGVVFPQNYKKYAPSIQKGNMVIIDGKLDVRQEKIQIIVNEVLDPKETIKKLITEGNKLYLRIKQEKEKMIKIETIYELIRKNNGHHHVILFYESNRKVMPLGEENKVDASFQCIQAFVELLGKENVVLK